MASDWIRWNRSKVISVALLVVVIGVVVAYQLAGDNFDLLGRDMLRRTNPKIVMNPDSTQFAYALDYRFSPYHLSPNFFDFRPAAARVEIWIYDLARKKGPRRIGGWPHNPHDSANLLQWTSEGLYIAYSSNNSRYRHPTVCDLIDPMSGSRSSIGPPPLEKLRNERPPAPLNYQDEYYRTPHVVETCGEFFEWDPATFKLISLFSLPIDPNSFDPNGRELMRSRVKARRLDGFQRIARVDASETSDDVLLQIHTYARRAAPFARQYRLQLEIASPEGGRGKYETIVENRAVWDTLVTPNPARDTLLVRVPYERFWKTLRPNRELMQVWENLYPGTVYATLVPDSLPGDAGVPPGFWKGTIGGGDYSAHVEIPLP